MATALRTFLHAQRAAPTLSLAYADIGDEGCLEVAKFLSESAYLEHVDLTGNGITAVGAAHLAGALRLNRTCESLVLNFNSIGVAGEEGLSSLCRALSTNTALKHLDLRHNSISGGIAVQCIGDMLKSNTTLTHLELSWNPLQPAGGQILLDHVNKNTTLFDCQLSGCKISDETMKSIAKHLFRNRKAKKAEYQEGPYASRVESDVSNNVQKPEVGPWSDTTRELHVAKAGMLKPSLLSEPRTHDIMMRLEQWMSRPGLSEDSRRQAQELHEYVDKVQKQLIQDQKIATDLEEHVSLLSQGFRDREERYKHDINLAQEKLIDLGHEKDTLQSIFKRYAAELRLVREQHDQAFRERDEDNERHLNEEERCRAELSQIMAQKRALAERKQELEGRSKRMEVENQRLRTRSKEVRKNLLIFN